jgi:hypothetical protein
MNIISNVHGEQRGAAIARWGETLAKSALQLAEQSDDVAAECLLAAVYIVGREREPAVEYITRLEQIRQYITDQLDHMISQARVPANADETPSRRHY